MNRNIDTAAVPAPAQPHTRLSPGVVPGAVQHEVVRLKTLYVLFLMELHTRRVRLAGVTDHPNGLWVVQRAREFSMNREPRTAGETSAPRFLVRDRDSKFTRAFDAVFASDGVQTIKTPIQAPNANAFAERVGTNRAAGVPGLDADLEPMPP